MNAKRGGSCATIAPLMRHMQLPRPSFTYANVTASLALFIALGGTSYAVAKLPKNSVGSEQVRDGTLKRADLAPDVIKPASPGARGPRGAAGPAGASGASGTAGAPGPAGFSNVRITNAPEVELSRNAFARTTVMSLNNVPAGSHFVTFTGEASHRFTAAGYYVFCEIMVNGVATSQTRGLIGDNLGGEEALADITTITRSSPFDLSVSCFGDQPTSGPAYMLRSKLAVMKVDTVTTG